MKIWVGIGALEVRAGVHRGAGRDTRGDGLAVRADAPGATHSPHYPLPAGIVLRGGRCGIHQRLEGRVVEVQGFQLRRAAPEERTFIRGPRWVPERVLDGIMDLDKMSFVGLSVVEPCDDIQPRLHALLLEVCEDGRRERGRAPAPGLPRAVHSVVILLRRKATRQFNEPKMVVIRCGPVLLKQRLDMGLQALVSHILFHRWTLLTPRLSACHSEDTETRSPARCRTPPSGRRSVPHAGVYPAARAPGGASACAGPLGSGPEVCRRSWLVSDLLSDALSGVVGHVADA